MKLSKEQLEELKQELSELTTQRDEFQKQAQDQLTSMGGAIFYITQLIQKNEQEDEQA
jgi:hypothetical protein